MPLGWIVLYISKPHNRHIYCEVTLLLVYRVSVMLKAPQSANSEHSVSDRTNYIAAAEVGEEQGRYHTTTVDLDMHPVFEVL